MIQTGLVRYDAACRALSEAKTVDEAKELHNIAAAMQAYARQAKNRSMETDAAEIRIRAERRLGELIHAQKETVGLNRGAFVGGTEKEPPRDERPTLADAGIDKKLSSRAQKLAALPTDEFESRIGTWRSEIEQENERITTDLLARDFMPPISEEALAAHFASPREPLHVPPRTIDRLCDPVIGPTDWMGTMKGYRLAQCMSQLATDEASGAHAGYTGKLEIDIKRDWNDSGWNRLNGEGLAMIIVPAIHAHEIAEHAAHICAKTFAEWTVIRKAQPKQYAGAI